MPNDINGEALVSNMYKHKSKLEDKATDAAYVGGFHLGPVGIPHKLFGGLLQSDESKQAQQEPQAYLQAMNAFLKALDEALDKAIEPVRPQ